MSDAEIDPEDEELIEGDDEKEVEDDEAPIGRSEERERLQHAQQQHRDESQLTDGSAASGQRHRRRGRARSRLGCAARTVAEGGSQRLRVRRGAATALSPSVRRGSRLGQGRGRGERARTSSARPGPR